MKISETLWTIMNKQKKKFMDFLENFEKLWKLVFPYPEFRGFSGPGTRKIAKNRQKIEKKWKTGENKKNPKNTGIAPRPEPARRAGSGRGARRR